MFLSQPLLDVLAGRGIEDIDSFLQQPSWRHLPDPWTTPNMEKAVERVLQAVNDARGSPSLAITIATAFSAHTSSAVCWPA
jgi:hypothetical protein